MKKRYWMQLATILSLCLSALAEDSFSRLTNPYIGGPTNNFALTPYLENNDLEGIREYIENADSSKHKKRRKGHALADVALRGTVEMLQFLENELRINIKQPIYGIKATALHYAAQSGNIDIIRFLIEEKGMDPEIQDNIKRTPLHYATDCHSAEEPIRYLVSEQKVDINAKDKYGNTALTDTWGNPSALAELINLGADCFLTGNYNHSGISIGMAHEETAKQIFNILNENQRRTREFLNSPGGEQLIIRAVRNNRVAITNLIEQYSINLNTIRGSREECILAVATANASLPLVQYIYENHRKKINTPDVYFTEPLAKEPRSKNIAHSCLNSLQWAAMHGNTDTVKYFIEVHGMDPREKSRNNWNTLFYALHHYGSLDTVKYLVEKCKMDINQKDRFKKTALLVAAINGSQEMIKYLIEECNADITNTDSNGFNIFQLAAAHNGVGGHTKLEGHVYAYLYKKYKPKNGATVYKQMKNLYEKMAAGSNTPNDKLRISDIDKLQF